MATTKGTDLLNSRRTALQSKREMFFKNETFSHSSSNSVSHSTSAQSSASMSTVPVSNHRNRENGAPGKPGQADNIEIHTAGEIRLKIGTRLRSSHTQGEEKRLRSKGK
ncbi:unnamed protein product [Notodromas monacha]|uniref:Uncharacterized protein n=1 Tax=Notodromas monacha TaxID=399045 RepID=A0A7R9GEX5_9CRUS|nr:unnamed protein product [Notodromas monacha]CAG0920200.1 unnamed protein product [Notodromas monacha]